ncbi:MAG TPA: hypothetical protein VJV03_16065 [Pyrinomonadaceae bacterium]|nr:hypothetical protein [Pyrinomonadaceae bacterium]
METGAFLTRGTIWVSIVGYAIGSVIFALSYSARRRADSSRRSERLDSATRVIWTVACAGLFAHFVSAFHFYHGWSHAAAYEDTARQTRELFGLNWGGGVFINYLLLVAWMIDVGWWWASGLDSYRKRPLWLLVAWHGFLIFIIFNATVVFGDGIVLPVGVAICLVLTTAWAGVIRARGLAR